MSSAAPTYSSKSPAVRRIMQELRELRAAPAAHLHVAPAADDIFDLHFTIRGPSATAFEGGKYHGRLLLPTDYPFKPPNIIMLTPNGRFELNTKICLSITGYHPEFWQPAWGVRTALLAVISFLPTRGEGAIGAIDWSDAERRRLAKASGEWRCAVCEATMDDLLSGDEPETGPALAAQETEDLSLFQLRYDVKEAAASASPAADGVVESAHAAQQSAAVISAPIPLAGHVMDAVSSSAAGVAQAAAASAMGSAAALNPAAHTPPPSHLRQRVATHDIAPSHATRRDTPSARPARTQAGSNWQRWLFDVVLAALALILVALIARRLS